MTQQSLMQFFCQTLDYTDSTPVTGGFGSPKRHFIVLLNR